jgi:hypothetical protein
MPCITIIVPGLDHDSRVLGLQKGIQESAAEIKELGLKPDDFWVYVQTAYEAPAIKVTIEALKKPERTPAVMQILARVVAAGVKVWADHIGIPSDFSPSKGVVVFTSLQDENNGFCEVGAK